MPKTKSSQKPESTCEAEATFGPTNVAIRVGDITEAACDAIVCSTDKHFKMTGAVAYAIRHKTGLDLDKEIAKKKKALSRSGIAFIPTKGMTSKCIIVVNTHGDWEKSLRLALTKADDEGHKSVAVPLISTDIGVSTGVDFGGTLCKIVTGISFKRLKKVEVVLIRQTDFTDVASGVQKYVQSNGPRICGYIKGKLGEEVYGNAQSISILNSCGIIFIRMR
ncbi:hypothetical protein KP79_PYT23940 [Mizuhopecten yessoensis]|uniref:Macro domain-containing protein n=1 Tax=Mizuhopecten yessoensis TaxID=6573 RepID=A0A210QKA7_MIZYE|nr:hypothetical protein KP79_PYT23940 [Mizuhopecten yessoensis]